MTSIFCLLKNRVYNQSILLFSTGVFCCAAFPRFLLAYAFITYISV